MSNNKEETIQGTVIEALPNTMFKVQIDSDVEGNEEGDNNEVLAYLAGKMRLYRIRVVVGDKVELMLDPYGGKARIVKRL